MQTHCVFLRYGLSFKYYLDKPRLFRDVFVAVQRLSKPFLPFVCLSIRIKQFENKFNEI
jgi:hypothetical protein